MNSCVNCSAPIPRGQRTCSICYGDPEHGSDGYYRQWMEEQQREADREREEAARAEWTEQAMREGT